MFIKKISIRNFRIFSDQQDFEIDNLNVPDNQSEGSGLTLLVGENGCGKTSLLDALALPLLAYKTEKVSLSDFFNPQNKITIDIYSYEAFNFDGTMPRAKYRGKGFSFKAGVRQKDSSSYLSSIIVNDQQYIRADGETKPEDGKPDLRVAVNNPWKGPRFNENDILFLDKNRTFQTRLGTYNSTKFDRLMEDFDLQYVRQANNPLDCNEQLGDVKAGVENASMNSAIQKFQEISDKTLTLGLIENWRPFSHGFLGVQKDNKQIVLLENLGSGYEMIFSLIYSFYLSQQSKKQLIVLIDEPELHLHPKLQEDLVKVLLEFSKSSQIILTTHSPLFVKQVVDNEKVQVNVLKKENEVPVVSPIDERVLPYLSANEINFIAFGLATAEYHNELYNELETNFWNDPSNDLGTLKQNGSYSKSDPRQIVFDNEYFANQKNEVVNSPFKGISNKVTVHTFMRNKIHHSSENGGLPSAYELNQSIKLLRTCL